MELRAQSFFDFINERESIRLRKEAGDFFPWTDDPILRAYKFTNVHRHHDRTSKELRERFYERYYNDDRRSILMNCALFRYFGTWEFADAIGWQDYDKFDFQGVIDIADQRFRDDLRVFTGAYVITNQGISAPKQEVVVNYFLKDLHKMTPRLLEIAQRTQKWQKVSDEMRNINGFGGTGFMTKEILLDTTYTGFWERKDQSPEGSFSFPMDWKTWTPIGPGARRGAARVLGDDSATPISEGKSLWVIQELLYWVPILWKHNSELVPTDIQFQLCEFDKYERVRLGQGKPRSRYRA
jgi:hypothetical protein